MELVTTSLTASTHPTALEGGHMWKEIFQSNLITPNSTIDLYRITRKFIIDRNVRHS